MRISESEFDFRVWDCDNEAFLKRFFIDTKQKSEKVTRRLYMKFILHSVNAFKPKPKELGKDLEVELWTGLKDINGVPIYVGDILGELSMPTRRYLKFRIDFSYLKGFYVSQIGGAKIQMSLMYFLENNDLLVIGNIHENPELLKSAKKGVRNEAIFN